MITRRKFIAGLAAIPAAALGARNLTAEYWWLPERQRDWIKGAGQLPHIFYEKSRRLVTSDVNYWRLSVIAHGGHDPLTSPWRRSRAIDEKVTAQILASATVT